MKMIAMEKQDDIRMLQEVMKICNYFCDPHVKEVETYDNRIAACFRDLEYEVAETGNRCFSITRKILEREDIGYDM